MEKITAEHTEDQPKALFELKRHSEILASNEDGLNRLTTIVGRVTGEKIDPVVRENAEPASLLSHLSEQGDRLAWQADRMRALVDLLGAYV